MKDACIHVDYRICSFDELSADDLALVEQAKAATHNSFSPYSHFSVGAALLLDNGVVVQGANQENASFTTGLCAERTAAFYANAHYPDAAPTTLAIAARGTDGEFTVEPVSPCGACRQVLVEIEHRYGHPMRLLLVGRDCVYELKSIKDIVPFSFTDDAL